jgi:hypothetical protein
MERLLEALNDKLQGLELLMVRPKASKLSIKPTVIMRCSKKRKRRFEKVISKLILEELALC